MRHCCWLFYYCLSSFFVPLSVFHTVFTTSSLFSFLYQRCMAAFFFGWPFLLVFLVLHTFFTFSQLALLALPKMTAAFFFSFPSNFSAPSPTRLSASSVQIPSFSTTVRGDKFPKKTHVLRKQANATIRVFHHTFQTRTVITGLSSSSSVPHIFQVLYIIERFKQKREK